jgi:hypothetical protein
MNCMLLLKYIQRYICKFHENSHICLIGIALLIKETVPVLALKSCLKYCFKFS